MIAKFYIVSDDGSLDNAILDPSIPSTFLVRKKYVNWQIPRVQMYRKIEDAISGYGIGRALNPGKRLFVYEIQGIHPESLIKPAMSDCPYGMYLSEWWFLRGVRLKFLKEIELIGIQREEPYRYGPKAQTERIIRWKWRELLKPWEKLKKKK